MHAIISRVGKLVLIPEGDTEEYAALQWFSEACEGKVELCVEMEGLTMGPQPCHLLSVPRETGEDDEQ